MIARFFIDRPIFAAVLSIMVAIAGGAAAVGLPVSQYPQIAPPTIQVDCAYPGASAQVVAESVAAPIEQQVNGVEDMMYMSSSSTNDGSYTLTIAFRVGTDLNLAQVRVQNRVNLALPALPDVVKAVGVTTRKRSSEILQTVMVRSLDDSRDQLYLSNYAVLHLRDELSRLPGISDVLVFGQRDYAMRVWVDPDRLAARSLTSLDVVQAIREQNVAVSAGQLGQPPTGRRPTQLTLALRGRLDSPEDFGQIVVKAQNGRLVRIKDVARVELGAKSEDIANRFDAQPTVGLAIFLLSDANALATADAIAEKLRDLARDFPPGVTCTVGYDTTPFIRESIWEVVKALRDSILLVAAVVLLFLQSWRAALIPLLAVPVAIVGAFAAMAAVGFTVNNLTLFGLVLAVGIVVDDAIVVVEAVERQLEAGLAPRAAALRAMEEVSGPIVAVGLVLSAVFIPCAFVGGLVGLFFTQFALTIAISTLLSTFNSLTLSPALAALLLRPRHARPDPLARLIDFLFGWLFRLTNAAFRRGAEAYLRVVGAGFRVLPLVLLAYAAALPATWRLYRSLPTGFIPSQDKGYLLASVQLPDAASVGRTRATMQRLAAIALGTPGVRHCNSVAGNSFLLSAYGSNFGSMFVILDGFDQRRHSADLHADNIMAALKKRFQEEVPEADVNVFGAPAVSGLGRAGGFKLMLQDRAEHGLAALQKEADNLIRQGKLEPSATGLFTAYRANSPQLFADVDRAACLARGIDLAAAFGTMQSSLGSLYVNDFNRFGRTWQVVVQAEPELRAAVEDVGRIKVRNRAGGMAPLSAVATVRETGGPLVLTRYNMHPAAPISGAAAKGASSGQAMAAIEAVAARELPAGYGTAWTEIAYLEQQSGADGLAIFGFAVAFVFLVLAALYESWSLPIAAVLVVPMGVLSALAGIRAAEQDVNIFTQVGFVVLVGLACKNAILIVEFAKRRRDEGADRRSAALAACRMRLRPILMTSFAFVLGVAPLLYARGAGAEMRRALGVCVFSGMLGVTFFGLLLTPAFYVLADRLRDVRTRPSRLLQRLHAAFRRPPRTGG